MRSAKPDFRLFGQVRLAGREEAQKLAATLPPDAASATGDMVDVEYAGFFVDTEEFLKEAARLMRPGDEGHLDVFDDENRVLTRYDLRHGGHESKSHRYDDILEHTKGEGNW